MNAGSVEGLSRTVKEAGWHASRYTICAPVPGKQTYAVANLFKGYCAEYSVLELYLLSIVDRLREDHPILERFRRGGLICNFDELAALETMGRAACTVAHEVSLTICPTLACNFDCPYCFESHGRGHMSREVQDDVVALARRMLDASGAKTLRITWFGGEPLMYPDIVASLSERLISLADERGVNYRASIFTNGYLLTQEIADMLGSYRVEHAQITIDGVGETHDRTRRLADGGPTFERIASNLRTIRFPFKILLRHNVSAVGKSVMDELAAFAERLAEESGNDLVYHPVTMVGSAPTDRLMHAPAVLSGGDAAEVGIVEMVRDFRPAQGNHCPANVLWSVAVDDQGRLLKCWESVAKPELAFGTARDWDPRDPLATAETPDNLTMYLNTSMPIADERCRSCVWLPVCAGGCPQKLLFSERECVPYKDDPEAVALALYDKMVRKAHAQR